MYVSMFKMYVCMERTKGLGVYDLSRKTTIYRTVQILSKIFLFGQYINFLNLFRPKHMNIIQNILMFKKCYF